MFLPGPTGHPGVDLAHDERRHGHRVLRLPGTTPVGTGREASVRRIEVELPDLHGRHAAAEQLPARPAVVGDEGPDIGARIERVRDSSHRVWSELTGSSGRLELMFGPAHAAVGRLEDVAGTRRRASVEAVERHVRDPIVGPVDGDVADRPVREDARRRRGARSATGIGDRIRAELDPALERSGVDAVPAARHADRADIATAGAIRSGARAARREVRADGGPVDCGGVRRLRVVGPVEPIGAQEQLVRVPLVHDLGDVEVGTVGQVDPARDRTSSRRTTRHHRCCGTR